MPYEFDIMETTHVVDQTAEERGSRDAAAWQSLTVPMDERSRAGWELVDVDVHLVVTPNKYGRPQKVRTVISVWKRPVAAEGRRQRPAKAAPAREPVLRLED